MTDDRVLVRATIHQAGSPGEPSLAPGDQVYVKATTSHMRRRIKSTALVKVRQQRRKASVTVEETPASVPDPTDTQAAA